VFDVSSPSASSATTTTTTTSPSSSIAAQAAASLYNSDNDNINISQLPSEAKPALMVRLMSATLIELTSKETLAMVSCADNCWHHRDGNSGGGSGEGGRVSGGEVLVEVREDEDEEEWSHIEHTTKNEKEEEGGGGGGGSSSFVWPAPAKSRRVSEETVDAVLELITGNHRKQDVLTGNAFLGAVGAVAVAVGYTFVNADFV
jgi:hypothetical protein